MHCTITVCLFLPLQGGMSALQQPPAGVSGAGAPALAVPSGAAGISGVLGATTKPALPAAASARQQPAPDGGAVGGAIRQGLQSIVAESPAAAVATGRLGSAPKVQPRQVDQGVTSSQAPVSLPAAAAPPAAAAAALPAAANAGQGNAPAAPLPNIKLVGDSAPAAQQQQQQQPRQLQASTHQLGAPMSPPAPRPAMVRVVHAYVLVLYSIYSLFFMPQLAIDHGRLTDVA